MAGRTTTPAPRLRTELVLRITAGPAKGAEHLVTAGESCSLGRSEDAGFSINDSKISRLHCRVELVDGKWTLKDLDSRNGTWVAQQRIVEHVLSSGTSFVLGKSTAVAVEIREAPPVRRVVFPGKEADAAPSPPSAVDPP